MVEKKNNKSPWRKFWVILGLAVLFACGVAVGIFYDTTVLNAKRRACVPDAQCSELANKISNSGFDLKKQEQLIVLYNDSCFYNKPLDKELNPTGNAKAKPVAETPDSDRTCEIIESLLKKQLEYNGTTGSPDPDEHFARAQVYAKLSNLGCIENYKIYRNQAMKELAIAHALNSGKLQGDKDTIKEIEEYKKMKMRRDADKVLEKVKGITDPAIEFILEVEKVITTQ